MTVRARLVAVIFITGLITALGVMAMVALAFQRFEHERSYDRANAFLERVLANYSDMLDQRERHPQEFDAFLRSLLLFEADSQLYLLDTDGTVLASTGSARLGSGFKVAIEPVRQAAAAAAGAVRMPYVMGDDPEHMARDAVIAARALRRPQIRPGETVAGYLYLVCSAPKLGKGPLEMYGSGLAGPALLAVVALIVLMTLLAAWVVAMVTRPLRVLSAEVAAAAREGFNAAPAPPAAPARDDEFGRLQQGFHQMLAALRAQWNQLRELDRFRRESVSNLSHDLRSPLTATTASLETLQQRWQGDAARQADAPLVEVALRNTRNAARLVRSLGDLALLDEPGFKLHRLLVDLGEVLDDIALRFADRAARQGVVLQCRASGEAAPLAEVDVELFERAVANLLDNALKFTARGGHVTLSSRVEGQRVLVRVEDDGAGIEQSEQPLLFDRLYQARSDATPASAEGGKGLGLAIVKRIVELHGGEVSLTSAPGRGTTVTLSLPQAGRSRVA